MTTLVEKVIALDAALEGLEIPHAFGGALALAFHVREPRATRDIDVNIFLPAADAPTTLIALPAPVVWSPDDLAEIERSGQVRIFWDDTPVDLFFVTHPFHDAAATRTERVPFAGRDIPILAAEDLAVFKAFFDRTKDWADIEAMIDAHALDPHAVIGWIVDLVGGDDHRVARLLELVKRDPPEDETRFAP
jgi:hypothetical protein